MPSEAQARAEGGLKLIVEHAESQIMLDSSAPPGHPRGTLNHTFGMLLIPK